MAYFKIDDSGVEILFHRDEFADRPFKNVGNHWGDHVEGPIDIPSGGSWILWDAKVGKVFFLVNAPGTFGPARGSSNMSRGLLLRKFASTQGTPRLADLKAYRGRSAHIFELDCKSAKLCSYSIGEPGLIDVSESPLREGVVTPHGFFPNVEHMRARKVMEAFRGENGHCAEISIGKLDIVEGYGTLHSVQLRMPNSPAGSVSMIQKNWVNEDMR